MKPNQKVQLTLEAYNELKKELDSIKDHKLPAAIDRVAKARAFGDISENSEYDAAQEDLAMINGRMDELSDILNRSVIVQAVSSNGQVGIGSVVQIEVNGNPLQFTIVGEWEADPAARKISHESPLGKALIGRKVGETVEVEAPAGRINYQIKAIK